MRNKTIDPDISVHSAYGNPFGYERSAYTVSHPGQATVEKFSVSGYYFLWGILCEYNVYPDMKRKGVEIWLNATFGNKVYRKQIRQKREPTRRSLMQICSVYVKRVQTVGLTY